MTHRSTVFYGWWVVAAASVGMCFSTGTIVVLSFGVFFKPLSQYFNSGRTVISLAFTLHGLVGATCVPFIGRLVDHFGARRIILTGTTIFGLILLSSELVANGVTYLYVFYLALGIVSGSTSPVPYGVVVSHWFDRRRGLALGLMAFGLGIGAIAMPLIAERLIEMFGWRATYASFGGAALFVSLPVVAGFLKEDPRQKGMWPDGIMADETGEQEETQYQGLSWRETWHQPTFWLLMCAFSLAGASLFACVLHMPALLTDRGVSPRGAAIASSVVGIALLIGRMGTGYLLDRIFAPRLAMILFGGSAVGIALLWAGSAGNIALVAACLVGLGMGAEVDIIAYLLTRYFGLRSLGTAFGYGFGGYALGGSLGVLLMGAGFDLTGSYTGVLGGFFFAMVLAAGIMTRLGPYLYAPQKAGNPLRVKVPAESHA